LNKISEELNILFNTKELDDADLYWFLFQIRLLNKFQI
jgi:hypothetical protein